MKAEDVVRIYRDAGMPDELGPWDEQEQSTRDAFARFARACEQHGVERAKALASATCCHECGECGGEGYVDNEDTDADDDCPQCKGDGERLDKVPIDWSALVAEIAKENEGG